MYVMTDFFKISRLTLILQYVHNKGNVKVVTVMVNLDMISCAWSDRARAWLDSPISVILSA